MPFIARYSGLCGFCDEQMRGKDCAYTSDDILVHLSCLTLHESGVNPVAVKIYRSEKRCRTCLMVHAGECL